MFFLLFDDVNENGYRVGDHNHDDDDDDDDDVDDDDDDDDDTWRHATPSAFVSR